MTAWPVFWIFAASVNALGAGLNIHVVLTGGGDFESWTFAVLSPVLTAGCVALAILSRKKRR